jgi:anti-sigma factor RsiW
MMYERDLPSTLRRLLGPDRPELSCEDCLQELDRYVEAEVAAADPDALVPGLAAHLEGCPACAEDHASLVELVLSEGALAVDGGGA